MECVHNVSCKLSVIICCCFYLYNDHIKEGTFDIFDKHSTGIAIKELTNVEIKEKTASL